MLEKNTLLYQCSNQTQSKELSPRTHWFIQQHLQRMHETRTDDLPYIIQLNLSFTISQGGSEAAFVVQNKRTAPPSHPVTCSRSRAIKWSARILTHICLFPAKHLSIVVTDRFNFLLFKTLSMHCLSCLNALALFVDNKKKTNSGALLVKLFIP